MRVTGVPEIHDARRDGSLCVTGVAMWSGRETVGSLVVETVSRLGSPPFCHPPEQLHEAVAADLASQGQAP